MYVINRILRCVEKVNVVLIDEEHDIYTDGTSYYVLGSEIFDTKEDAEEHL